jgi:hypothetical protein
MTVRNIDTHNKADDEKLAVKTEETTLNAEVEKQLERAKTGMLNAIAFANGQR